MKKLAPLFNKHGLSHKSLLADTVSIARSAGNIVMKYYNNTNKGHGPMGVKIKKGVHNITFKYTPNNLSRFMTINLIIVIILYVLGILKIFARRKLTENQ